MSGLFKSMLLCREGTVEYIIQNDKEFILNLVSEMLEQARGVGQGDFVKGAFKHLHHDLKLLRLRKLLSIIIRSANSGDELRSQAIRLLLRLGYMFSSAHDMLLAAEFQKEYSVDISYDLMPLLDKSESFLKFVVVKPSSESDGPSFCKIE